jgi:hypothetical protein
VVLPSATFSIAELRKITAILHYEERMLFTTLFLRHPRRRLVYITSLPVDEAIVEYYLSFLPDPEDARSRLDLVALGEDSDEPLTHKLLRRPDAVARVRELVDGRDAYVLPFNVTAAEGRLADALDLPFYGAGPELAWMGSKTGSRQVARRAGVAVPEGSEGHHSLAEVEGAVHSLRQRQPIAQAVVIKLNEGFSGQGNAIVDLNGPLSPLRGSNTTFCAAGESWSSYPDKVAREGAIVEELLRHDGMASPSVQVRIAPSGTHEVLSTHDQILGGTANQVYLGCRFPAQGTYRLAIQDAATRVAEVLFADGVIGSFGIDFLVLPGTDAQSGGHGVYLSEINLRMGGTTHPYWMTRLATEGEYQADTGELVSVNGPRYYVATDNLKSERLAGLRPGQVIDAVDRAGLGYDRRTRAGATLHLLGAIPRFAKMGTTCIGGSPEEADELYREVVATIEGLGGAQG